MYLLFDKVYVKPMYMLDMERPRVIISPDASSELLEGIETKFRNLGEMFYNVDGYDELVGGEGEFADDKEFFNWLLDKGRVDVFVDSDAYHKIFVKWIKIMYPDIPKELAWKVYSLVSTHTRLTVRSMFTWGTDNEGVDAQKTQANEFKWLTQDQFQGLFKQVQVVKDNALVGRVRAKAPMEFMLAGKLNGKTTYDETLKQKIYAIGIKKVRDEMNHVKNHLLHNINKPWVQKLVEVSYTAGDDLFALKGTNAKIDFLLDEMSEDALSTHDVDIADLREGALTEAGAPDGDSDIGLPTWFIKALQGSSGSVDSATLDKIIEFEVNNVISLFEVDDRAKVNVMLLNYFYNLKNNNTDELAHYSIG